MEAAVRQCHRALSDGGYLLLGWNDVPRFDPAPLSAVSALARFARHAFPPLGVWRYRTDTPNRHTFDFYRKSPQNGNPAGADAGARGS